jgi:hypothetical protein
MDLLLGGGAQDLDDLDQLVHPALTCKDTQEQMVKKDAFSIHSATALPPVLHVV